MADSNRFNVEFHAALEDYLREIRNRAWQEGFAAGYVLQPRPDWANASEVLNPHASGPGRSDRRTA
jgi:hypothetical protein